MNATLHPAALSPDELLAECATRRGRRSGPGGQHRNKVETAIVLTHQPTGVLAEATERRSQAANRRVALFRLRVRLATEIRRSVDLDSFAPSPLWQSRAKARRIAINAEHDDFPALLAEALDVLAASDSDVVVAAERLAVSPTQLVRLLAKHPVALEQFNRRRAAMGLRPLR